VILVAPRYNDEWPAIKYKELLQIKLFNLSVRVFNHLLIYYLDDDLKVVKKS